MMFHLLEDPWYPPAITSAITIVLNRLQFSKKPWINGKVSHRAKHEAEDAVRHGNHAGEQMPMAAEATLR